MKLDVFADLDHLFMINFSAREERLAALVPRPLRLLTRNGYGFPSIVLPRIEKLRPSRIGFPRVNYELFGLRILVEYESRQLGTVKGIYFHRLIMDPNRIRLAANSLTAFSFEKGVIRKRLQDDDSIEVQADFSSGEAAIHARVTPSDRYPDSLPPGSCFSSADDALAMYNDIAFGFLPAPNGTIHILQIADLHPNYVAWPLRHLEVSEPSLALGSLPSELSPSLEPCYFVGKLPRYWRWLPSEAAALEPAASMRASPVLP